MKRIEFILLMCCSTALAAAGNTAAPAAEPNDVLAQSRSLRHAFMMGQLTAVTEKTPEQEESALSQLINEVLSLQSPKMNDPNRTALPNPIRDPNAVGPETAEQAVVSQSSTNPKSLNDPTASPKASAMAEKLKALGDPQSAMYPLELADVLYRAGEPNLAADYYDVALQKTAPDDAATRAWILFQTANCLRHSDLKRAKALLEELIGTYPNCVWTTASKAQLGMLDWMQTHQSELQVKTIAGSNDES